MAPLSEPLISVITPTYNRADFVIEAARSVLGQTYPHFELWIVDDGSTDHTRERLEPLLADSRVRYIYQANQGQSTARNNALARANGDFVCFLDSDDNWLPTKLEQQLAVFAEQPEVDIVYGDYIFIDRDGEVINQPNMKRHSGRITAQLLRDNCVSMNTTMVRKRCFDELGGMSGKRRVADDYDLWLRFSSRYQFYYLPARLARYRIMEDQLSSDKRGRFEANESILQDFLQQFPNAVSRQQARAGLGAFYSRWARHYAQSGDRRRALTKIAQAGRYAPTSRTTWRALAKVLFPDLTRKQLRSSLGWSLPKPRQ